MSVKNPIGDGCSQNTKDNAVGSAGAKPLAVNASDAAAQLNISRAHFLKLHSSGMVPRPIRLGRAVRWNQQELEAWLNAGAPSREQWELRRPKR